MPKYLSGLAPALALCLPLPGLAQDRAGPAPVSAAASAPAPAHRSAFADYRPYREVAPGDWRRLNDIVGQAALKPAASGTAAPAGAGARPAAPQGARP